MSSGNHFRMSNIWIGQIGERSWFCFAEYSSFSPWMAIWRITSVSLANHQDSTSNSLYYPSNQLWMRTKHQEMLTGVPLINIHYHTIISTDDIIQIIQICKVTPQTHTIQIITHCTSWLETPMLVWVLTVVHVVVSNGRRKSKCTWRTCMLTDKVIQKEGYDYNVGSLLFYPCLSLSWLCYHWQSISVTHIIGPCRRDCTM